MISKRIWLLIFATMCTTSVIAMDPRCQGRRGIVELDTLGRETRLYDRNGNCVNCGQVVEKLDCRSCDQLRSQYEHENRWADAYQFPLHVRELHRRPLLNRMALLNC
jgi:hypothetical protein